MPAGASALDFVRTKRQRADGGDGDGRRRQANELRGVHISVGAVAQAAGSASIEVGRAKLLCTVHGPRPDAQAAHFSESGRLQCQVQFAAFSGVSEDEIELLSRELPLVIHPALEAAVQLNRFPKSLLEVHILVLELDGDICGPAITGLQRLSLFSVRLDIGASCQMACAGVYRQPCICGRNPANPYPACTAPCTPSDLTRVGATAATGASLALADAGIEMFDLVAACSVARSAGAITPEILPHFLNFVSRCVRSSMLEGPFTECSCCFISRAPDGTSGLVLDPGSAEGKDGALDGSIVMAVMPARGEVTQLSHVGEWDFDKYEVSYPTGHAAARLAQSAISVENAYLVYWYERATATWATPVPQSC
jgi:ribonuclease PH